MNDRKTKFTGFHQKNQRIITFCCQIPCSIEARSTAWNMRELSDFFTFQQDRAPAHRARPTVELLEKDVPDFISPSLWSLNSPVLNPVDYKIWSLERVYQQPISNIDELRECIAAVWEKLSTINASTQPYASCESVFLLVWKPKGDILNICLNKSGLVVVLHKRHL